MSVEVEDHEEVENDAPSDEDWEWPAEETKETSSNPKILQKEDVAKAHQTQILDDVKIEGSLSSVKVKDHEEVDNADPSDEDLEWPAEHNDNGSSNSSSRLPLLPKKAKLHLGPCPISICNKDFKTKTHDALRKHLSNSHFRGTYTCQVCTHWERFPTEIAEHVMAHHPGTDCVKCKRCNQTINFGGNPQMFEDHVR